MSGHSKWHNIKARKGKQDEAKSGLFTKYARLITVAAREGGGDQAMNFALRLAVDKAKAINMPKDNIERAIKRGIGELGDGTTLEEVLYEGFGPGGVAVIVDAVTDNKNRTSSDVKHLFSKYGGTLGGPGSVAWQFAKRGVVRIGQEAVIAVFSKKKDECELALIDAGAEDIRETEYGVEAYSPVERFQKVLDAVKSFGIEPDESGLEWVARETASLDSERHAQMQSLYDALDEHDDVRAVYTNEG